MTQTPAGLIAVGFPGSFGVRKSAAVVATNDILLSGDAQAGTDKLLLSGDEQSGTDHEALTGTP